MTRLSTFQKFFLVLFLTTVFLWTFNQLKESDSFYHLKTGQVIWESGSVPHIDIFSFTAYGAPWVTHEWLAELSFYGVYSLGNIAGFSQGGFWALIAFVALLASSTYWLLILTALRKKANVYITCAVAGVVGSLTFELWIPRPQVWAFFCFAVFLFLLEEFMRTRHVGVLAGIVGVMWLWANMHASVLLGITLLFVVALIERGKFHFPILGNALSRRDVAWLSGAAFASAAISLVNPNGYHIFIYRAYVESAVQQLGILEWKSILDFVYQWQAGTFLALLIVSCGIVVWRRGICEETRDISEVAIIGAVALLPIISIRHVGLWPIVAIPSIAVIFSEMGKEGGMRLYRPWVVRVVGIAIIIALFFRLTTLPGEPFRRDTLPVGAVDFIEQHHLTGPIFNLYNEGGYLLWRLWPKERVFIDGRSEVFAGKPIDDLFRIVGRRSGWDGVLLGKYHARIAMLPYRPSSLAKDTVPLSFELERRGFHLVYWDDIVMLLVRETLANKDFVQEYGFRVIHPFRDPPTIPEEELRDAAKEVESLLRRSPRSWSVQEYAKRFLESAVVGK
ncbi:MAG: hypothetical protein NUV53_00535 [Patescibacteria group bacterium]|nr:hypothetical protein [Patescibacteria group bacterium]